MIRMADIDDRPEFLRLWQALLTDQRKKGSYTWDNHHNLHLFLGFFEAYVFGSLKGCVVFYQPENLDRPVGVVMGGQTADPPQWETDLGEMAILWGVYVEPEYRGRGIPVKLFARAREYALSVGIDTAETLVLANNPPGEILAAVGGAKVQGSQYLISFHDPEVLNSPKAREGLAKE